MPLIGALLQADGSLVRVFAPNATSLRVYGDWNGWDEATAVDLAPAGGGFWEGQMAGLVAGGRYELLVGRAAASVNHRLDPAARDTDSSGLDNWHNKSQVVDTAYVWSPFDTPHFDDLILYQCHIGSFSGYRDEHVAPGGVASFDQLRTKLDYIRDLGFNALAAASSRIPVRSIVGLQSVALLLSSLPTAV